jgi:hypothetical protein
LEQKLNQHLVLPGPGLTNSAEVQNSELVKTGSNFVKLLLKLAEFGENRIKLPVWTMPNPLNFHEIWPNL